MRQMEAGHTAMSVTTNRNVWKDALSLSQALQLTGQRARLIRNDGVGKCKQLQGCPAFLDLGQGLRATRTNWQSELTEFNPII